MKYHYLCVGNGFINQREAAWCCIRTLAGRCRGENPEGEDFSAVVFPIEKDVDRTSVHLLKISLDVFFLANPTAVRRFFHRGRLLRGSSNSHLWGAW